MLVSEGASDPRREQGVMGEALKDPIHLCGGEFVFGFFFFCREIRLFIKAPLVKVILKSAPSPGSLFYCLALPGDCRGRF